MFVEVSDQTITRNIGCRRQLLVGKVLLHLGHTADTFFRKPLKLSIVNVGYIHCQGGILGQVHLFEKIMIVFGGRSQFDHHRHTYLILHDGVYLLSAFLLSAFRMSTYSLENVVKGVGRHPKSGKKKGDMKVHTVMKYHVGVPMVVRLTSAAKHDHYLLKEVHLPQDATLAMGRAYMDIAQFQRLTEEGVCYVTKMMKNSSTRCLNRLHTSMTKGL